VTPFHRWADQVLYDEAKRIFFAVFTAFLQSRGEPVPDILVALEKYKNGPIVAKPRSHAEL
jgi:hypothetical protein